MEGEVGLRESVVVDVALRVEVPETLESPVKVRVDCGETSVLVYEHGYQDSGHWAVWHDGRVVRGGTFDYPYEKALREAHAYVVQEERRRLLYAALTERLTYGRFTQSSVIVSGGWCSPNDDEDEDTSGEKNEVGDERRDGVQ